jgi:hypothetical protein
LPAAAVTPAAVGALRALAGLLVGGTVVLVVLAVALLVSGGHSLTLHPAGAALLSLGFASASTATIVALAGGLRAPTLALVFAIATFWTAAALPLWFAIPATLITGLVLAADTRARGGARIGGRVPVAALAAAGAMLLLVAAATAEPRPAPRTATHGGAAAVLLAPAKPRTKHAARSHAAPRHTVVPATTPAAPAPTTRPAPAEFVRAYYAALDEHHFADAWKLLSPAVQARFGTFADWRGGYATTLASAPEDVRVFPAADGSAIVRNVLVARDRTKCGGTLEQRFAVTWKLVPAGSGWAVASLVANTAGTAAKASPCP